MSLNIAPRAKFSEIAFKLATGVLVEEFTAPCVRGDGVEIWAEGIHSAIEWRDMPAILVTVRDVTHIKLREMEIEKEKERLIIKDMEFRESIRDRYRFRSIVGKSLVMQNIYEMIIKAAESDDDVIIAGESGPASNLVQRKLAGPDAFMTGECDDVCGFYQVWTHIGAMAATQTMPDFRTCCEFVKKTKIRQTFCAA